MSSALRVIVHPPDTQGGRRVRVDGENIGHSPGRATSSSCGGGPAWTPTTAAWTTRY
ncbi:hypothetical protein ACFY7H_24755 [Streptomyces sp. NPDC012794]|uniref:hypothetical protein n=1 Tax=Streptomyces sp. NPDC012794 TaxID=3364850 RepID=UPI0036792ED6